MRRLVANGFVIVVLAFGAAALFASLDKAPEAPLLVVHTNQEEIEFGAVIDSLKNIPIGGVAKKEDRLPIVGKPVKTETIIIPIDTVKYDDVVRATRSSLSPRQFQDRWPE